MVPKEQLCRVPGCKPDAAADSSVVKLLHYPFGFRLDKVKNVRTGPRAYAPDALQPVGLLCYPCTILVF
jgi:hypothetical protein